MSERTAGRPGESEALGVSEVADALWLLDQIMRHSPTARERPPQGSIDAHLNPPGGAPSRIRPVNIDDDTPQVATPFKPSSEPLLPPQATTVRAPPIPSVALFPASARAAQLSLSGFAAEGFQTPSAAALSGKLAISRALRPLHRRIPSRLISVFDEHATVERVAGDHILSPVMRPKWERWFDLQLVIDRGASMGLWWQTVEELRSLMIQQGSFRDVRTWGLITGPLKSDQTGGLCLYPGARLPSERYRRATMAELIAPGAPRLIVVVSDCIGPAWQSGALLPLFRSWGRHHLVTIVQVLPRRMWARTALGTGREARLYAPETGAPNARLSEETGAAEPVSQAIAIPVVTLDALLLGAWARFVARAGAHWLPGVVFHDGAGDPLSHRSALLESAEPSPTARVARFDKTSSELARRLARIFTAVPLELPIMRLAQRNHLSASGHDHMAEVLLGGLVREISAGEPRQHDALQFEFLPGVLEILEPQQPVTEAIQIIEEIADYIAERRGQPAAFRALLATAARGQVPEIVVEPESRPFAALAARHLRRMGGVYAALADRISIEIGGISVLQAGLNELATLLSSPLAPPLPAELTTRWEGTNVRLDVLIALCAEVEALYRLAMGAYAELQALAEASNAEALYGERLAWILRELEDVVSHMGGGVRTRGDTLGPELGVVLGRVQLLLTASDRPGPQRLAEAIDLVRTLVARRPARLSYEINSQIHGLGLSEAVGAFKQTLLWPVAAGLSAEQRRAAQGALEVLGQSEGVLAAAAEQLRQCQAVVIALQPLDRTLEQSSDQFLKLWPEVKSAAAGLAPSAASGWRRSLVQRSAQLDGSSGATNRAKLADALRSYRALIYQRLFAVNRQLRRDLLHLKLSWELLQLSGEEA